MEKFIVTGGNKLSGNVRISGAKNAALKTLIAACMTDEEVVIKNVPLISDLYNMIKIIKDLGGEVHIVDHTVKIRMKHINDHKISLDTAARMRTSFMFIVPLLLRAKEAVVPNPGGCRLGARPVDRLIGGLRELGADITYNSEDGFFYTKATQLRGTIYEFEKNTHMGTETLILGAVLAEGKTVLKNAAEEPEIDDLIGLLNAMGADIKRSGKRQIEINGVKKLSGAEYTISPDRNEIVTFACTAIITKGDVLIEGAKKEYIGDFLEKLALAGGGIEEKEGGMRFYFKQTLRAVDVETRPYPGFMTDWQAPWAVLMTQATGDSTIHETVFEDKLGYIHELQKMGARARLFNPTVENPEEIYNFNLSDDDPSHFHAVRISGPTKLHEAVITMRDIRAGAAVLLAALAASGTSSIYDVEKVDRGYENLEKRLEQLGAKITRVME
jgi:UDP-N-acetylglucosamine 1-carboxyvinyltransferase